MSRIVIVGSGASAVHCALSALEAGAQVTVVDVGYPPPTPVLPESSFEQLKDDLKDPNQYFLGAGEGVVYPETSSSYYGHPPSKRYVFAAPQGFTPKLEQIEPVFSFARGGMAGAWTAGAYTWNEDDLEGFPVGYHELLPFYQKVIRRIGVTGAPDDLDPFLPVSKDHQPPLPLDPHSEHLLERYRRRKGAFAQSGFVLGRSRVATLSESLNDRAACGNLGRCLWGCPTWSLYHPAVTLAECKRHDQFSYLPGHYVTHFEYGESQEVTRILATDLETGASVSVEGDLFVLAAGALNTTKIYLESWYRATGDTLVLGGLMDNRQVHVPFLTPKMIGQAVDPATYQFHHLAFGIVRPRAHDYLHGQITTLRAAAIHPVVSSLPMGLRLALRTFQTIRTGLGVANLNMSDERRKESTVTLQPSSGPTGGQLSVKYVADPGEPETRATAVADVRRLLKRLGAFVPTGMTRVLPMGTSAHYAGTLPMTKEETPHTSSPEGRVHGFPNLYVADGATFPTLPAKNLTLTLMANAARIAESL